MVSSSSLPPELRKLSDDVYVYDPSMDAPGDSRSSASDPTAVVLYTWADAHVRLIQKYLQGYKDIYPSTKIIIVMAKTVKTFFGSQATNQAVVREMVVKELWPLHSGKPSPSSERPESVKYRGTPHPRILMHAFSNSGGVNLEATALVWHSLQRSVGQRIGPLPIQGLILDSTPGGSSFSLEFHRWTAGVALGFAFLPRLLAKLVAAIIVLLYFGLPGLLGKEVLPVRGRRVINSPDYIPTTSARLYIYSDSDPLIGDKDVESHGHEAKAKGYRHIELEKFQGSGHVAHMRQDPKKYWASIARAVHPPTLVVRTSPSYLQLRASASFSLVVTSSALLHVPNVMQKFLRAVSHDSEAAPIMKDPRDEDYEPIFDSSETVAEAREGRAHGVAEIEALATVWSTKALHIGYALVFVIFFINSFQQETTGSLSPYVYSKFANHSLVSRTNVLTNVVGGVAKLPCAMLIDVWGRPKGFGIMTGLCTLGLFLMAICANVETYVTAQVIYWVGYNGMDYVLHIFLSDTTDLVNRSFVYGMASTPYVVTTFAGPAAAQSLYEKGGLWWGFGIFVFLTPLVTAPFMWLLWASLRKAYAAGLIRKNHSQRTWTRSIKHYFIEFDTIGLSLVTIAFVLMLLPLTPTSQPSNGNMSLLDRWRSLDTTASLSLGVFVFMAFVLWERFCAPVCFLPFSRLKDRTLLGACFLAASLFASFYCWDLYLASYLQVTFNTSIRETGYIYNIYTIGTCLWSVPLGLIIRKVDRLKWIALAAMPLIFLGTGLMIHFRSPQSHIGYVVLCEVFKALAGGTLVICQQMAAMATGGHESVAVSFALVGLFTKLGGGIGSAISGAIWTNTVPVYLERYLPPGKKHKAAELYGSIEDVLSYPIGTPERDATILAYGVAQRRMLIAGLSILPLAVASILMWRDIRLKKLNQVRGTVF
ncbi:siderophore iron transporter [Aspergillus bombycis]|uniref:Siderophore iron transporter n=1 Tax=Aspergillus bombycis TaxID=109264 RepID=A0A1F8AHJ4_9EURO|nr:siderophore iron transporter [Aspergillus bombycis]OGM51184.1 siderophore iron transporter [Aspergillus bombycis]